MREVGRTHVAVQLFHVLAVIALAVGESKQALLENGIRAVPQRQTEAKNLAIVTDAREPVFVSAIGARTGVVVRKIVPGGSLGAIVLSHRAPSTLGEIRPPPTPTLTTGGGEFEALFFGHIAVNAARRYSVTGWVRPPMNRATWSFGCTLESFVKRRHVGPAPMHWASWLPVACQIG
jgi:hypothetical protein